MAPAGLSKEAAAELQQAAEAVLRRNDRGTYSVPTQGLYPVQFNWDSAFASLGYRWLDADRAWTEIETLLAAQQEDGRVPHIMFRGDYASYFPGPETWQCGTAKLPISGLSNPPVLAFAVRRLLETGSSPGEERLAAILSAIANWHRWFMDCRRDAATGAILIAHPWESGRDNLCDWDAAMQRIEPRSLPPYERMDLKHVDASQRPTKAEYDRYLEIVACGAEVGWDQRQFIEHTPFRMVDVGMTAFLLRSSRDLDAMLYDMNMKAQLDATAGIADRAEQGLAALWNDETGTYASYDPVAQRACTTVTSASFLAPFAGVSGGPKHSLLMKHFDRFARNRLPIASFDPDHEKFDSRCYHRGPVWMPINLLIEIGLDECGEHGRAEQVRASSLQLTSDEGLREYYDPIHRVGLGGRSFTWTAAATLDWLNTARSRDLQEQA